MQLKHGNANVGATWRCGEMMALEWSDVDLNKRQLCIARSDWKGRKRVIYAVLGCSAKSKVSR